jgi:hypothetical protein
MKPLAPATRLFDALHEHDIRYCHWKSNEHLLAGLAGETDLDLLFDRRQFGEVTILLAQCGFRRFDASARSRTISGGIANRADSCTATPIFSSWPGSRI